MAKEFGLNALHLEALGESCQWEIVVGGDILERLVEIQCQFKRLAVMGDDEYRGFYIEVSRPTPEEWGDAGELIASGLACIQPTGDAVVPCRFDLVRGFSVASCYGPEAYQVHHHEPLRVC